MLYKVRHPANALTGCLNAVQDQDTMLGFGQGVECCTGFYTLPMYTTLNPAEIRFVVPCQFLRLKKLRIACDTLLRRYCMVKQTRC